MGIDRILPFMPPFRTIQNESSVFSQMEWKFINNIAYRKDLRYLTDAEANLMKNLFSWAQVECKQSNVDSAKTAAKRIWDAYDGKDASLSLDYLKLNSLPNNVLSHLTDLKSLSLEHNCFITLPSQLIELKNLRCLDLSSNEIASLSQDVFKDLGNLEKLYISDNELSELHPQVFTGLMHLNSLYLDGNQITKLAPELFKDLGSLEKLNISSNQLSELQPQALIELKNLRHLDISSNKIVSLSQDLFKALGSLEKLNISSNQLSELQPQALIELKNLRHLDISSNKIASLSQDLFKALGSLEKLNISYNQLSELHPQTFTGLVHLKSLYLNNNGITGLSLELFENLINLTWLELDGNPLTNLNSKVFDKLINLETLCLFDMNHKINPSVLDLVISSSYLTLDERKAMQAYVNNSFSALNNLDENNQRFVELDKNLRTAITKLSKNNFTKTFRGGRYVDGFADGGDKWKTDKFLSTSRDIRIAKNFAWRKADTDQRASITVVFGQSGADVSVLSSQKEKEVLYNKGTEFKRLFLQEYNDLEKKKINVASVLVKQGVTKYQVIQEVGTPDSAGSVKGLINALDLAKSNKKD